MGLEQIAPTPPDQCGHCGRTEFRAQEGQLICTHCGQPALSGGVRPEQMQWAKVLALTLPRWGQAHQVSLRLEAFTSEDGMQLQFHASRPLNAQEEQSLLQSLALAEEMLLQQAIADAMKELGADPQQIAAVVDRGRASAAEFKDSLTS